MGRTWVRVRNPGSIPVGRLRGGDVVLKIYQLKVLHDVGDFRVTHIRGREHTESLALVLFIVKPVIRLLRRQLAVELGRLVFEFRRPPLLAPLDAVLTAVALRRVGLLTVRALELGLCLWV